MMANQTSLSQRGFHLKKKRKSKSRYSFSLLLKEKQKIGKSFKYLLRKDLYKIQNGIPSLLIAHDSLTLFLTLNHFSMKTNALLFTVLLFFCTTISLAQTATVVFIHNQPSTSAAMLDLQIWDQGQDTLIAADSALEYPAATSALVLPSSLLLRYQWYETGTSTLFSSRDNQVLDANTFSFAMLYGTNTQKRFSRFTNGTTASSTSQIRFDITQAVSGLPMVDFILRGSGITLADNMDYGDLTFSGGPSQFDIVGGDTAILDIVMGEQPSQGICAFKFDQTSFAGKTVYFITSGSTSDLKMYAVEVDGTMTELVKTSPISSMALAPELASSFKLYPNPTKDFLKVEFTEVVSEASIEIFDLKGTRQLTDQMQYSSSLSLDLSTFPQGIYLVKVETEIGYFSKMIMKE